MHTLYMWFLHHFPTMYFQYINRLKTWAHLAMPCFIIIPMYPYFQTEHFFYFFDPLNIKFINLQSVFITFICQYLMNYFVIHFHGEKGLMLKNSQTPCWYPDPSIMEEQNLEVPIVLARGYNLKKSHKNDISIFNEYNF